MKSNEMEILDRLNKVCAEKHLDYSFVMHCDMFTMIRDLTDLIEDLAYNNDVGNE